MATRQQLEGKWNEVKGKLKEKWGTLTDDDLVRGEGNVEQLVGVIQRKTGKAKEEVEKFIDEIVGDSEGMYDRVATTAREYTDQATQALREGYDRTASQMSEGYRQAEQTIKRNPVESIAVAFGAGIVSGVLVGLMLRRA
ncbi:MAG: DUF883 family protein [Planctomycetaceae bacterium]|nr:DUF883 family protein [Planctomycetaceae bacterium]